MNEFAMLLKRELWEHRALYVVPVVFVSLIVLAVIVGIVRGTEYVGLSEIVRSLETDSASHAQAGLATGSMMIWLLFSGVTFVMVAFYLLDSLFADRKDRSVLFWKSLPIGDTRTVLSKLVTAIVVAPAIAAVAALATVMLVLIVASVAVLLGGGNPLSLLWGQYPLLTVVTNMLGISVWHALWFLPLTGWLMLASASARRTPFLLATLVPLGLIFAEKVAFDSNRIVDMIGAYCRGLYEALFSAVDGLEIRFSRGEVDIDEALSEVVNLTAPLGEISLYVGVLVGAALIAAAVVTRHRRIDIN